MFRGMECGRRQRLGIVSAAGIIYATGSVGLLHVLVFTNEEKQERFGLCQKDFGLQPGREVTA
jgi:hypothetical protein